MPALPTPDARCFKLFNQDISRNGCAPQSLFVPLLPSIVRHAQAPFTASPAHHSRYGPLQSTSTIAIKRAGTRPPLLLLRRYSDQNFDSQLEADSISSTFASNPKLRLRRTSSFALSSARRAAYSADNTRLPRVQPPQEETPNLSQYIHATIAE